MNVRPSPSLRTPVHPAWQDGMHAVTGKGVKPPEAESRSQRSGKDRGQILHVTGRRARGGGARRWRWTGFSAGPRGAAQTRPSSQPPALPRSNLGLPASLAANCTIDETNDTYYPECLDSNTRYNPTSVRPPPQAPGSASESPSCSTAVYRRAPRSPRCPASRRAADNTPSSDGKP